MRYVIFGNINGIEGFIYFLCFGLKENNIDRIGMLYGLERIKVKFGWKGLLVM